MGNGQSEPCMNRFLRGVTEAPNMRVSLIIIDYCSLESSDNLRRHYESRRMAIGDGAAEWAKSLVEKLACFAPDPNMAGLGALAVAILIDNTTFSPPEDAINDALRCVFAEEKASEIWVHISDCLRRCVMNHTDKNMLKKDLERIESQLCTALSRLLRSIVADRPAYQYMTADAIKAWVNGAAFHIQMLIHLVRLGGFPSSNTVERLINSYQSDLDRIIRDHKYMIKSKCRHYRYCNGQYGELGNHYLINENSRHHSYCFESNLGCDYHCTYEKAFGAYYDRRFGRQMQDIQEHFSYVRKNLQSLLQQRGFLKVTY